MYELFFSSIQNLDNASYILIHSVKCVLLREAMLHIIPIAFICLVIKSFWQLSVNEMPLYIKV